MSALTVQQRRARHYMAIKAAGDREVCAAEQLSHASSSTPTLQRIGDDGRVITLVMIIALAALGLAACGEWRARPDLKTSTLTQSSAACVRGHKTEQVGTTGLYGTPVVLVTADRCEVKP